ncbi:hypothetical protein C6A88_23815 [Mycolicibacterium austroafricanum]|jgi:hypothetical protein|nr:hypothetical protein C6A88_23815 [Mycolicibacterium austroafricanum]
MGEKRIIRRRRAFAGTVLAIGLGLGSVAGAAVANAGPVTPGVDIAEKPHHDDWKHWGPGPGRGKWAGAGWDRDVDACISATDPAGYVSGYVCI